MSETRIELWGRVGKEPEHRKALTPNMMFPLAYNTKDQKRATWYDVYSEIELDDIKAYLHIGDWCSITGIFIEVKKGKKTINKIIIRDNGIDKIEFKKFRNNYNN